MVTQLEKSKSWNLNSVTFHNQFFVVVVIEGAFLSVFHAVFTVRNAELFQPLQIDGTEVISCQHRSCLMHCFLQDLSG